MKWFRRPKDIRGLILDMDNTLYTNPAYTRHQEDVLIERLARERAESTEAAQALVKSTQEALAAANNGRKTSLGNTFLALGIPMATSVAWREECIRPEDFLGPDPTLAAALADLAILWPLVVLTNNPSSVARRTFATLGVGPVFQDIIGLERFLLSKPHPRPFEHASEVLDLPRQTLVSIGDRVDVDLHPALDLGMGALLIEHVTEIHTLKTALQEEPRGA